MQLLIRNQSVKGLQTHPARDWSATIGAADVVRAVTAAFQRDAHDCRKTDKIESTRDTHANGCSLASADA